MTARVDEEIQQNSNRGNNDRADEEIQQSLNLDLSRMLLPLSYWSSYIRAVLDNYIIDMIQF